MARRRLSSARRQVVAEIVRLIVPAYPDLDEQMRARVHADVTDFVTSQIEALPSFLQLPYRLGITAFRLLSLVRHGRRFVFLSETAKRAYISLWSDGKLRPARDFIKLIRGCALLAYFDHPDVAKRLLGEGEAGPEAVATGVSIHS